MACLRVIQPSLALSRQLLAVSCSNSMSNAVSMKSFLEHKKKLDDVERFGTEKTSEESYDKEFAKIREISQSLKTDNVYPFAEGMKNGNEQKNRFKDIVPFDYCRVVLKNMENASTGDYINASYIKGALRDQRYIAAQGPLPKTVNDFWQMIWENNVKVMLMACREYEDDPPKLKCQRYWPNSTSEEMSFGPIIVTLEKEERTDYKEHVIRHMIARVGSERRKVVQFHHCDWNDASAINDIESIVCLVEKMREKQAVDATNSPPVLVHCSAGCGRTGSVIVIDFVMSLLKCGKLPSNFRLFDVILEFRRQRMAIVQSLRQYVFVHEVVASLFTRHLEKTESPKPRQAPVSVVYAQPTRSPKPNAGKEREFGKKPQPVPRTNNGCSGVAVGGEKQGGGQSPSRKLEEPPLPGKIFEDPVYEIVCEPPKIERPRLPPTPIVSRPPSQKTEPVILSDREQVIYKGLNISYPNRIHQHPRGKRDLRR